MQPSGPLVTAFRSGFGHVKPEDWDRAEGMWRFSRLVRLLSEHGYELFRELYELVHEVQSDNQVEIPREFHKRAALESNKQLLATLSEDDLLEEEMKQREAPYFRPGALDRIAVARKLTLVSEMNQGFIADKKLWRWIEDALEQGEDK